MARYREQPVVSPIPPTYGLGQLSYSGPPGYALLLKVDIDVRSAGTCCNGTVWILIELLETRLEGRLMAEGSER